MKIYILYSRIFDLDGRNLTIGGIQTYLLNLIELLKRNNYNVEVYQSGNKNWKITHNNTVYNGIDITSIKKLKKQREFVYTKVLEKYQKNDIIIFGTDSISIKNNNITSISIQHGIHFDYLNKKGIKNKLLHTLNLDKFIMYLNSRKAAKEFLNAKYKICVDYNFLNWIRTRELRENLKKIYIIPNFTHKNNTNIVKNQNKIKILFARRFMKERGVYILEKIISVLSEKYNNIEFTIAGSGQLEEYVRTKMAYRNNVSIIKYKHTESLDIHSKHDIALIPSYGSEGTSLSLLEAMTSECIPIASNIGGMTNIILNNYNGFLVNPIAEEFIDKIELLLRNQNLRKKISKQAKLTADEAFSYEIWCKSWLKIIRKAANNV